MRKKERLIVLVIVALVVLTGCNAFKPPVEQGSVEITLNIPEQYEIQASTSVTLSTATVELIKGSSLIRREIDLSSTNSITISAIEVGDWEISVHVRDSLDRVVFKGTSTVTVAPNSTVVRPVGLVYAPGDLKLTINYDSWAGVTSGTVTLISSVSPENNITRELQISEGTATVNIIDLSATTWPAEVTLRDQFGEVIRTDTFSLEVLPGRLNEYSFTLEPWGIILIDLIWEEPPLATQGLTAELVNGAAVLTWEPNSAPDMAGYLIYRSDSLTGEKTLLDTDLIIGTTYTDTFIVPGCNYWYWIKAIDTQGFASSFSEPANLALSLGYYEIAYLHQTATDSNTINVMYSDGTNVRSIYPDLENGSEPSISPDGSKVVYHRPIDDFFVNHFLYIANTDGSEEIQGPNTFRVSGFYTYPSWSHDSTKIAYASFADESDDEIWIVNADGTEPYRITNNLTNDLMPKFSPDDQYVAYLSGDYTMRDLKISTLDGNNHVTLTSGYMVINYAWSPDGSQIAFTYTDDGWATQNIALVNADGTNLHVLLDNDGKNADVQWSPDGSQLYFNSEIDWNRDLYRINVDGTGLVNLTNTVENENEIHLSPDGSEIIYNRDGSVWRMNADGSSQVQLTDDVGEEYTISVGWIYY